MAVRAPAAKESREGADERLLVAAAQKDPSRFGELYEAHFDHVYAYIARRVGSREIAEDLTSEVFHKALANLRRFEWRGTPFVGWLLRIAANAIIDQGKRSFKEATDLDSPEEIAEVGVSKDDMENIIHRARLFRLVDELPADQRRVVAMRFAEEKSIREIADEIGRSEGAVKQLQFRGLQNLRGLFEKKAGTKPGAKNG